MKDGTLARLSKREAQLQQELEGVREELKQGHASWGKLRKELNEQLFQSEVAREALFKQLAETGRKLTFHSAQVEGKREAMMGELEKCRAEISRLEGVVKEEVGRCKGVELEVEQWKVEAEKAGGRCREAEERQREAERRWGEERARKEASEQEGDSLRQEVGRLSEALRACQHQLQAEREGKVERERDTEDSLARLQQELTKRAQQVSHGKIKTTPHKELSLKCREQLFFHHYENLRTLTYKSLSFRCLKWTDCCKTIRPRPRRVGSNWSAP